MGAEQLIDPKTFTQLQELDSPSSGFLQHLYDMFTNQGEKLINEITEAIAENNPAKLQQAAHTFKGASLNMGATVLGHLCLKLEQLGKSGSIPPDTASLRQQLVKLFDESKEALHLLIHDGNK